MENAALVQSGVWLENIETDLFQASTDSYRQQSRCLEIILFFRFSLFDSISTFIGYLMPKSSF